MAAPALSVLFSAMADWYRCVAASQPRYPTSIDVSTNPQHTSIPPLQASNPSSIHPRFDHYHTWHTTQFLYFFRLLAVVVYLFFPSPIYLFQVYYTSPGNRVSISSARPVTSIMSLFSLFQCVFTSLSSVVCHIDGGGGNDEMIDMRHHRGDRY